MWGIIYKKGENDRLDGKKDWRSSGKLDRLRSFLFSRFLV
jgi:hypothetical protein